MRSTKRESANLDLLRSLAVILVFSEHALVAFGLPWEGTMLGALGHLGVLLFFIHTSLVLMMSLERLEESGDGLIRSFYIRRAFRIYPLAIVAVLLVPLLRIPQGLGMVYRSELPVELWSNLLLIQNLTGARSLLAQLWSLPFEVQMYLVLPFLYRWGKQMVRTPMVILGVGVAVWLVGRRLETRFHLPMIIDYAPWFCMGVTAFFRRRAPRLRAGLWVLCLAFMASGYVLVSRLHDYRTVYLQLLLGAGLSYLLPMFRELVHPAAARLFHLIAKYSYGIYLSHLPILWFAFEGLSGKSVALRTILCVGMLIGIPVLLYHTIEEPFIRWGARLAGAAHHRIASITAAAAGSTTQNR
jgi:peptidoglycan/LPS O-acetylase OafA/YrhL